MSKHEALNHFNLDHGKPVLAVIGGSQGSKALNDTVTASVEQMKTNNIQILWQTGMAHYEQLKHFETDSPVVKVFPFTDDMGAVYSAADLIVSRAGALALAEIAYCGKPSLLIPFPGAAANHQMKNAQNLADRDAAVIIKEGDLANDSFTEAIQSMIGDKERLAAMSIKAGGAAVQDAAERIVDEIVALAEA
ncbi:MAG: glycosyltransferase [Candidatus Marinimicrobia bacterium]|nr:glycosyltransferase [Candidatus Neomarinimicrobiota bacterium]